MRYVHLRGRTKVDDTAGGLSIIATAQVANDLTDQVSADDGIVLTAQAFAVAEAAGSASLSASSSSAQPAGPPVDVAWQAHKQCVRVPVPVSLRGRAQVQVVIRGRAVADAANPAAGKKGGRGQKPARGLAGAAGNGPDLVWYDTKARKLVFPGIVSVWSAPVGVVSGQGQPAGLGQRAFRLPGGHEVRAWEDVGSSQYWASVWDSGLALAAYLSLAASPWAAEATLEPVRAVLSRAGAAALGGRPVAAIELGCGCGLLGVSLFQAFPGMDVLLTDLPQSAELVEMNIEDAKRTVRDELRRRDAADSQEEPELSDTGSESEDGPSDGPEIGDAPGSDGLTLAFAPLDWMNPVPDGILARKAELIFLSDCTYNTDTIPALVDTLARLARATPRTAELPDGPLVLIARKIRHESEHVFDDLMAAAGFRPGPVDAMELPGNGSLPPWMVAGDEDGPGTAGRPERIEVMTFYLRPSDRA